MNKTLTTFFTVLFCLTSSVGWSLEYKELIKRDGLYYKKFTDVPFTGEITGQHKGLFKNGKKEGSFIEYWNNGQLFSRGNWKNGKMDGSWVGYKRDGTLYKTFSGTFKNDEKIN